MSAPAKPRKAAVKKRSAQAASRPAETVELEEFEPVTIGQDDVEMTTIFILDDVEYQIPKSPNPVLALQFQRDARNPEIGRWRATENVLVDLIGQGGLDALKDPRVSDRDVERVFMIVGRIFFGGFDRLQTATDPS